MKLTCCSTWEKAVIYNFTFKILDMALKLYLNIIIIFQYWSIFQSDDEPDLQEHIFKLTSFPYIRRSNRLPNMPVVNNRYTFLILDMI